jgi:hypothetical protein
MTPFIVFLCLVLILVIIINYRKIVLKKEERSARLEELLTEYHAYSYKIEMAESARNYTLARTLRSERNVIDELIKSERNGMDKCK